MTAEQLARKAAEREGARRGNDRIARLRAADGTPTFTDVTPDTPTPVTKPSLLTRLRAWLHAQCWWGGHVPDRKPERFMPFPYPTPYRCTRCGARAGWKDHRTGAWYGHFEQWEMEQYD